MPELPEIICRASEMNRELPGRRIAAIEILQPKCLNVEADEFQRALSDATIQAVTQRGKWLFIHTTQGWLLINLGMGGEVLLTDREHMPEKYRLVFDFEDGACLAVNFWWFGYAHYVAEDLLAEHRLTSHIGPNALEATPPFLAERFAGQRTRLKSWLLNQENVAGIGNAYIHDILYLARLHPQRAVNSLSPEEIEALVQAIHRGLEPSIACGGAFYEKNLYGQNGGFRHEDIIVGYREGQPCPTCATPIVKIKTGSTSSFICPTCQV
ncbi:MAG: DNA-formamidopyrimidine glycosylase family protein [Anaerolineaceae bacterium]|nr:DNA-formamidopyrimidine glycosylase family protein [Anaerolineaceae bacterium]